MFRRISITSWKFLLAGKKSAADPSRELERFRRNVEAYPFQYEEEALHLTVTIGAAWFLPGYTIDEWIDEADKRLYEGKKKGKNRVVFPLDQS